jgi:HK97 family phage portal protein
VILAGRNGSNVEVRDVSLGSLMELNGMQLRSGSSMGGSASASEIAGLPAFQQGIRIAAQSIAKLELGVWRGPEENRERVRTTWQSRFFANPPSQWCTWMELWEATEGSLTARNNAFWHKSYDLLTRRVAQVEIKHPDDVRVRWNRQERRPEYSIHVDGAWSEWLTSYEVLHFRVGFPSPGALLAPSPIEMHRRQWATMLAKERAAASVYDRGSMRATAVVFPDSVSDEQAKRFKETFIETGGEGDSPIKVFGGNPRIEQIGLSFQDQQFVETQQYSLFDVGRILGVLPSLLFAAMAHGGDKPITPEHEEDRWSRYGLEPRRARIEQKIASDPAFFGPGARDYPWFYASRPRSDAKTESEMLVREVQAGIRLPDEARSPLGLPDLPDGQGKIPQITPVGGAPNDVPAPTEAA